MQGKLIATFENNDVTIQLEGTIPLEAFELFRIKLPAAIGEYFYKQEEIFRKAAAEKKISGEKTSSESKK